MEPKIESRSAFRVGGRGAEQGGRAQHVWCVGNYEDSGEFDYVAGINVSAAVEVPEGMVSWDTPAQTYAVFSCTLPTLGSTLDHIHETWLPTSGYRHVKGPALELYDEDFDPENPDSLMCLFIPIE